MLKQTTQNAYAEWLYDRGHIVLERMGNTATSDWTISCQYNPEHKFDIKVNYIRGLKSRGERPVCPHCKYEDKIEAFLERSSMVENYRGGVACTKCPLQYRYVGDYTHPLKCFCQTILDQDILAFIQDVHSKFPGDLVKVGTDFAIQYKDKKQLFKIRTRPLEPDAQVAICYIDSRLVKKDSRACLDYVRKVVNDRLVNAK